MFWCALYLAVAAIVAVTAFVTADFVRAEDIVAPASPGTVSVFAGALWPIVIIGAIELALAVWLAPRRLAY